MKGFRQGESPSKSRHGGSGALFGALARSCGTAWVALAGRVGQIGRHKVAKAAEYGAFLNDLYERHFTKGGAYWKQWNAKIEEWGLNRGVLARYQLIAAELKNRMGAIQFSEFDESYEVVQ